MRELQGGVQKVLADVAAVHDLAQEAPKVFPRQHGGHLLSEGAMGFHGLKGRVGVPIRLDSFKTRAFGKKFTLRTAWKKQMPKMIPRCDGSNESKGLAIAR
jgi:hypothetical protein